MNILVVGNVLKDIYLNLDSRTEKFEIDKKGTKWLNFSFDASEHHFFSRESNLSGAAVTFEVLSRLGLKSIVTNSDITVSEDGVIANTPVEAHRYILVTDGRPSYLVPTEYQTTNFATPNDFYDYIFIDRSSKIDEDTLKKLNTYLDLSQNTKLVLYIQNFNNPNLNQLISRADLIFYENTSVNAENPYAPELAKVDTKKLVYISEKQLSYLNIQENISINRVDVLTHLSAYSIAAATILGSFILGHSVEDSLRMARVNVENSKLDSTLNLAELQELADDTELNNNLELIAANLVLHPKGILAADESGGSIKKKFANLNIEDTFENRRDYRNIFFTTPGLEEYVNSVILFDETARQTADNGQNFVDYLTSKRIIPGIKVDQGLAKFENSVETYTKGLDNLSERLKEYYNLGLRFAKWRAAFEIHLNQQGHIITPTTTVIQENCRILAEYASKCQATNIVPIVEPEVVYDGYYSIEKSAEVTGRILDTLFKELSRYNVNLRACILKCNMVIAGKRFDTPSSSEDVGQKTAEILKAHVPEELAGVVFLSGGQTVEQATSNLASIIKNGPFPWPVTFSFARALQDPALETWAGDNSNADAAREAFKERLIANTDALKNQ